MSQTAASTAWLLPALPGMLRVMGAMWMAPAFLMVPSGIRLGLAVLAACVAVPLGANAAMPSGDPWAWAPLELATGLCIGGVAAAAAEALRWCGRVAGEQMGLSLAADYDPQLADETSAVERILGWGAVAAFVVVGGVEGVVLAAAAPGDGVPWLLRAEGWSRMLDASMSVGWRVCLPVLAITLAGTVLGGTMARAAPGTLTLAGGFGVRVAMGLGMLVSLSAAAWVVQADLLRDALGGLR
ncbi:MAG: flagellar biosynthetic protein FliR [Phycisphaerales bacterium]|jgi:flagellar biosynthetic protein FliR